VTLSGPTAGLSAAEWLVLLSAIVPAVLAASVYWIGLRLARRHDERDRERRA
jgi:hypothetical protein